MFASNYFMKKIIFVILGLLLIAMVGVGAYFFIQKNDGGGDAGSLFFGFGSSGNTEKESLANTNTQQAPTTDQVAVDAPVFIRKIHAAPVAGFGIDTDTSKNFVARYQERALGHIYETPLFNGAEVSVLDNTEPTVYESWWGKGGNDVIIRSMRDSDTIKTASLHISSQKSSLFPENIPMLALSPDKRSAFFLSASGQGTAGFVSNLDGTGKKNVFSSSFREWLPSWTSPSLITLTTKPSARANGSIYLLNTKTLSSQIAVAGKLGLTGILSPDGKTLVFTESAGTGMRTSYYTVASGKTTPAPFTTLPEKCVWSAKEMGVIFCAVPSGIPAAEYPDSWYRGDVSFSDAIWRFDARNTADIGRLIASRASFSDVDGVSLALDSAEKYLLFLNKRDGALWGIDLTIAAPTDID